MNIRIIFKKSLPDTTDFTHIMSTESHGRALSQSQSFLCSFSLIHLFFYLFSINFFSRITINLKKEYNSIFSMCRLTSYYNEYKNYFKDQAEWQEACFNGMKHFWPQVMIERQQKEDEIIPSKLLSLLTCSFHCADLMLRNRWEKWVKTRRNFSEIWRKLIFTGRRWKTWTTRRNLTKILILRKNMSNWHWEVRV